MSFNNFPTCVSLRCLSTCFTRHKRHCVLHTRASKVFSWNRLQCKSLGEQEEKVIKLWILAIFRHQTDPEYQANLA